MMIGSFSGVEFGAALTGAGARLQAALVTLGKIVGNSTLSAVKVDGAPGAKTATAASLAFTKYVSGAPAAYKKLTATRVKATAAALATLIENEIRKRGGQIVAPTTVAATQVVKRAVKKTAPKVAVKKKAAVKKVAAVKKLTEAQKKAAIRKGNAAALRRAAAAARAKAKTPADIKAAEKFEQAAAVQERAAGDAAVEAATAAREATAAAATEQVAAQSIAQDTAQAVAEQAPSAAAAMPSAAAMPEAAAPAAAPDAAMPSASDEGFFARNKLAIGIGALAVVGVTAYAINKKKKGMR